MNANRAAELQFDIDIERRVANALAGLSSTSLFNLRISCRHRAVTLGGWVKNEYERQVAQRTARAIQGVTNVVDHIAIKPEGPSKIESWFDGVTRFIAEVDARYTFARPAAILSVLLMTFAVGGLLYLRPVNDQLPVFPAAGRIVFEGRPIADAIVVFHPKNAGKDAPRPTGRADKDGNFILTTYAPGDGAPTGEYIVTAQQFMAVVKKSGDVEVGKNTLPPKYSSPIGSSLCARITDGQNELPVMTLSR